MGTAVVVAVVEVELRVFDRGAVDEAETGDCDLTEVMSETGWLRKAPRSMLFFLTIGAAVAGELRILNFVGRLVSVCDRVVAGSISSFLASKLCGM
mmetsp:Transcript_161619/g.298145  ORF Transcript_161619/g.298145 Transcript_161619/m.298145 type:complete len:96 (+) Transcript_161619:313-600(+)